MFNVLKDIKSGALPKEEIAGFVMWSIAKSFWFWLGVIVAAGAILLSR